ncbi:hypothetical protein SDC9_102717 [bioreactor metagenome]|uniref:Uncharacterized protein n=1 Tax=bioreactor metagenome TaxID=1076179 RepID=A0A645AS76_9ZZZZ
MVDSTHGENGTVAGAPSNDIHKIGQGGFAPRRGPGLAGKAQALAHPLPRSAHQQCAVQCREVDGGAVAAAAAQGDAVAAHGAQGGKLGGHVQRIQLQLALQGHAPGIPFHAQALGLQRQSALRLDGVPGRAQAAEQGRGPVALAVVHRHLHAVPAQPHMGLDRRGGAAFGIQLHAGTHKGGAQLPLKAARQCDLVGAALAAGEHQLRRAVPDAATGLLQLHLALGGRCHGRSHPCSRGLQAENGQPAQNAAQHGPAAR